jgi:hypothetical protein
MLKGEKLFIPNLEEYNLEVEKFKCISNELGRAIKYEEMKKYNLRSTRWYVKHSNNPKVTNFNEFIEFEVGMVPRYNLSKEKAIECILELQSKLGRPLMKKDLIGVKNNSIGQGALSHYWGGFNKMKEELGLEIVGKNLKEIERTIFIIKRDVVRMCAYILENENRYTITISDWKKLKGIVSFQSCQKWFIDNGSSVREFINSIGFELVESGSGLNYFFENDNEKVKSQFELEFTKMLRNIELKYNIDYTKDVRYSKFIDNYRGMLDCDYVIKYKDRLIYVEIAGMLRDYKEWYINDKPLNSKSKEKYRLKLREKENMLKDAGLEYYILFPCDLNEDTYKKIFN